MADFTKDQLEAMGVKELQEAFEQATGKATKTPNRKHLIKTILDVQQDDSIEPDVDQQFEEHEARLAEMADTNPFEGMTPQQIIEAAKAKGKAKVAEAKQASQCDGAADDATSANAKAKHSKDATPKRESDGLQEMDASALQALYQTEIGRPTGSTNLGYLVWKIREARKGNIKIGPAKERAPKSDKPIKVIPIRIEEDALAAMDELVAAGTYTSRMDIFRRAIAVWADMAGHGALSSLIVGAKADDQTHSHTGL